MKSLRLALSFLIHVVVKSRKIVLKQLLHRVKSPSQESPQDVKSRSSDGAYRGILMNLVMHFNFKNIKNILVLF